MRICERRGFRIGKHPCKGENIFDIFEKEQEDHATGIE